MCFACFPILLMKWLMGCSSSFPLSFPFSSSLTVAGDDAFGCAAAAAFPPFGGAVMTNSSPLLSGVAHACAKCWSNCVRTPGWYTRSKSEGMGAGDPSLIHIRPCRCLLSADFHHSESSASCLLQRAWTRRFSSSLFLASRAWGDSSPGVGDVDPSRLGERDLLACFLILCMPLPMSPLCFFFFAFRACSSALSPSESESES
mmetsp:Transcript_4860/g.10173  ORF Transcript_4860/g.10173 Transcript_4860/m.10173 type:complete len:202 (+) Transcript_4860:1077-1682(+)